VETQYFERPEGTLAYSDLGGDGELVLMVPGMGALRSEYRFLAPKLGEAGYRAVAVDLRGHGESSVPWAAYDVPSVGNDILALIEYLDAGPAHVIGTSFAAGAAVWAAAERPDGIRSLVLVGAFVRTATINPIMKALFWLTVNNPWRVRAWARYYGTLYPTRKPADFKEYVSRLKKNMDEPGRFSAATAIGNSSRQPSAERLRRVKAPTLVIMGTRDPDFPDPVAEGAFVAEQTGGTLELIDGAGHYPQTEMPEKTVPLIVEFLKRSGSDGAANQHWQE
jgi:pimeloyl-ACP methyl ester carboxylesterase